MRAFLACGLALGALALAFASTGDIPRAGLCLTLAAVAIAAAPFLTFLERSDNE